MPWTIADIPDLTGRVAIVTGASGGLGFVTTRILAARGARVVMAARNRERAIAAREAILRERPSGSLELGEVDLASLASVRWAADAIVAAYPVIDILVNDAGVMAIAYAESVDGHEMQLAVNHLGHFALTAILMPALLRSRDARVVALTSAGRLLGTTVDPADPTMREHYDPWRSYGRAKLATAQFAVELDRRLRAAGAPVRAVAADPGFSHTDLQARGARETGGWTQRLAHAAVQRLGTAPATGALPQIRAATDPEVAGGALYALRYLIAGPPVRHPYPSPWMRDRERERMWDFSERATGVRFDVDAQVRAARSAEG